VLTARCPDQEAEAVSAPNEATTEEEIDLCPPKGLWRNYNVCEDLTLGSKQRVMLSDESTLRTGVDKNGIKIFNYLSLIVNCHEGQRANVPGKYNVGAAKPRLVFEPIHALMAAKPLTIITTIDKIQKEIWDALQTGSVAVHCLAGVHRAPTVVVCHYLWRHYALGHDQVCCDVPTIYKRLSAIRPGVQPLGYIQLIDIYQEYLIAKYGCKKARVEAPNA